MYSVFNVFKMLVITSGLFFSATVSFAKSCVDLTGSYSCTYQGNGSKAPFQLTIKKPEAKGIQFEVAFNDTKAELVTADGKWNQVAQADGSNVRKLWGCNESSLIEMVAGATEDGSQLLYSYNKLGQGLLYRQGSYMAVCTRK